MFAFAILVTIWYLPERVNAWPYDVHKHVKHMLSKFVNLIKTTHVLF